MKIEIIENTSRAVFKDLVNDFLKDYRKEIFDIKYQVYLINKNINYSCMIIYREA